MLEKERAARVGDREAPALGEPDPGAGDGLAVLVAHRAAEAVRLVARACSVPSRV